MRQARDLIPGIESAELGWDTADSGPRDLAMLAHDIRSALAGVIGGISLLDRKSMDAEMRVQFERVAAAAEGLASLVEEALGDGPDWDALTADVDDLLRFLTRRWIGEAGEKGLTFTLTAGDDLPAALRVDFLEISRVLGNLIGNAIKFSDAGLVRLQVRRHPDGGLVFVLSDEGPGLHEGDGAHLFEYGYRSGGAGKPGQGLGLHIAKTLTERIGGRITLSNRPEGGLEAELYLPARLCEGRQQGPNERADALPDLDGLRILLAEDNPTNQMVASQMLGSMNAEVVLAADGVEALALFEAHAFDLLIVDIEMPLKSGLEVIREIRARNDARAQIPIVALTAYAMKEHRDRIGEAGADGLISKPIISIGAFGSAVAQHARPRLHVDAGTVQAAEDPSIDMGVFRDLAQAIGYEMMGELLDRVVSDLTSAGDDLRRAMQPLDAAAVRAASHILISVAGAVGAVRLQNCARALNTAAHAGTEDEVARGIRACLADIKGALRFVGDQRALC